MHSTGVAPLDALLGGGLDGGTATLLVGAAGTGMSSVTMQCATAALQRGHSVAVYLFDERPPRGSSGPTSSGSRCASRPPRDPLLEQIDPAEMSPGQFAQAVQHAVTHRAVHLVTLTA